jgi:MoxR-like ATPase
VTVGGNKHRLPNPFFVLATQNPIEQEGTYPLPEAQQDRFMFNVKVDYPSEADEFRIVETTTRRHQTTIDRVVNADELLAMQAVVLQVPVAEHVIKYAMRLTRKSRPDADDAPDFVRNYVTWGAGPRASQFLVLAGKARALLYGRPYVATEDIRAVAAPVLRHRLITNFNAEADGVKADDIVKRLIEGTPVER